MRLNTACAATLTLLVLLSGCRRQPANNAEIAVTNSYLGAAVVDVCPERTEVFCLAPPGMCPGHFDVSPSQVEQLFNSRLLLLFDFQKQIEVSLARVKARGVKTAFVPGTDGLCIPRNYRNICSRVRQVLVEQYPERESAFASQFELLETRLRALEKEVPAVIGEAGLAGAPVFVSHRQAAFARWLGLDVAAEFVGSDSETVANLDDCLDMARDREIRFVIANKQEGDVLARSLAERIGARAVVFSNFPSQVAGSGAFERLVRSNVWALTEAAR